ncbi:hypothetical protein M422DRAFT_38512 [Sphaerobolus stellatus SS14]|uniref:SAP domain-containing protein n=1 Tax=Sphaerobolus stellatus (strain SS14) TaxID=990650 RepID=A0A0C9UKC7_SPHS4|nr:hypothetical protein M422DRAFT_38512 [Sphaerobolus stellatus SS14]
MSAFSGSLGPKKKSELQEIAVALEIPDSGTRDELANRIKHHLAKHESSLSEDARFGGLYGRSRKRSVQPTMMNTIKEDAASVVSIEDTSTEERIRAAPRRGGRHAAQREREHEHEQEQEQEEDSAAAAYSTPPHNDSIVKVIQDLEPANIPLPVTPIPSAVRSAASAIGRDATVLIQRVKEQERSLTLEGRRMVQKTQAFLSDASNIYTMTLLFEMTIMLWAVVPTTSITFGGKPAVPPPPPGATPAAPPSPGLTLHYPSPHFFLTSTLWVLLGKWLVPTCVIPMFFGALISFNNLASIPSVSAASSPDTYRPSPARDLDPVTIGIMRVAFTAASNWGVADDVLPWHWRLISASVSAAFAFAEAIGERKRAALVLGKEKDA